MTSRDPEPHEKRDGLESAADGVEAAAPSVTPGTLQVLLDRNFGPYFAGNLLSNCGTWFQQIAQAILVFRLTNSSLLVGVVNFAQFAGVLVLAPWAGSAADRFDRRRLLVATQVASVLVTAGLAVLTAFDLVSTWLVIGAALLVGLANAFAIPAMQALVPLLVETDELGPAIALNSVTFNLARAVGPVAGAFVVQELGVAPAFGINSLSYLGLLAALAWTRPRPQAPAPAQRPRLRDSVRLVGRDARLLTLLVVVAAVALTADPVNTLTPEFAVRIFNRPDTAAGQLVGAFGAGAVLAVLFVAGRTGGSRARAMAAMVCMGVGMLGFALVTSFPLSLAVLALSGAGYLTAVTAATTRLQLEVEDAQRGRIMALWGVAFLGSRPLASLVDGGLARMFGVRPAAAAMALPALAGAGLLLLRMRRARRAA